MGFEDTKMVIVSVPRVDHAFGFHIVLFAILASWCIVDHGLSVRHLAIISMQRADNLGSRINFLLEGLMDLVKL